MSAFGTQPAFQVVGGLSEIGGAAEVAPIVVVGAEGENFLALGGEAEVGRDDGEDAFLGKHGEEAGGDHVDAGEGEGLERGGSGIHGASVARWRGREISRFARNDGVVGARNDGVRRARDNGGWRERKESVVAGDAAAAEWESVVEEEVAISFAGLDVESGEGVV